MIFVCVEYSSHAELLGVLTEFKPIDYSIKDTHYMEQWLRANVMIKCTFIAFSP